MDIFKEYLIHSYLYYSQDAPIISDHEFDALCKELNKTFNTLESPFKNILIQNNDNPPHIKGLNLLEYPNEIVMVGNSRLDDYKATWDIFQKLN